MLLSIPVDPDAETARRWAEDELAKPEYRENSGGLSLQAFWDWLDQLLARIGDMGGSLGVPGAVVVGIIVAAVLALVIWLVLGPLRRSRRGAGGLGVLDDDGRSWQEIRDSARAAQAAGDWDLAVMEWLRAVVRLELERGAILDSPGVTAREAAERIGAALPALAQAVRADALAFEQARYGSGGLGSTDAAHAERTFDAVERRRGAAVPA
ncbi:DUF4129 domain-containing protein [Demequina sp.]|uniref:DUF4129 domain-containing protein n=1 Tax=Demequina sp. TaxID=2050685 RepID=UPI003A8BA47A